MSFLSVAQDVALAVGIDVPSAVLGSSTREHLELASHIKRSARGIRDACDWQVLSKLGTNTGDGSTTAFDLPSDFHRLPKDAQVWSSRLDAPFRQVVSHDQWLDLETRQYDFVQGVYTILGGQMLIKPAMESTETATFYYQTRNIWSVGGTPGETPTADTDTFRLDEELLTLRSVWFWKQRKNLPYAEDMAEAEQAMALAIARDRGASGVTIGRSGTLVDAHLAYPKAITV